MRSHEHPISNEFSRKLMNVETYILNETSLSIGKLVSVEILLNRDSKLPQPVSTMEHYFHSGGDAISQKDPMNVDEVAARFLNSNQASFDAQK